MQFDRNAHLSQMANLIEHVMVPKSRIRLVGTNNVLSPQLGWPTHKQTW